jgi:hypothetical protein
MVCGGLPPLCYPPACRGRHMMPSLFWLVIPAFGLGSGAAQDRARQASSYESESKLSHSKFFAFRRI